MKIEKGKWVVVRGRIASSGYTSRKVLSAKKTVRVQSAYNRNYETQEYRDVLAVSDNPQEAEAIAKKMNYINDTFRVGEERQLREKLKEIQIERRAGVLAAIPDENKPDGRPEK